MSDFDVNPFADSSNTFSDESVRQARTQRPATIDEFNPFENESTKPFVGQPAVIAPSYDPPPPAYSGPSATTYAATEELKRRQEELERKAADLDRREQEMRTAQQPGARDNNFPPLPSCCPIKPCFYQDFAIDIPMENQKIVKFTYYLWISYSLLLFVNIGASLAYFISSSQAGLYCQAGTTFGLSILYFVLFTPCSFVCWYRPLYKAFRSDSSFNFFMFFIIFLIQFCANVIQCLGIDGSGTVGFLSSFIMMSKNYGVGIFMIIIGCLFAVMAGISIILLGRVHRIYRSTGASFKKAQEEFARGVVTNQAVQETAANVGSAAVRGAMEQPSGANRY